MSLDQKNKEACDLHDKGITLRDLGKYDEALKFFERAVELKPDYEEAWYDKGWILGKLGKYEEALKCYDKVIELRPDCEDAWYNKGVTLGKLGKYEEALKCYDKAVELRPDDEEVWLNKGWILGELGKYEEELKCYDKAVELKPDYEKAWLNKGVTLDKLGKYEEALKCYDKAVELKPDYEKAWYNKGVTLGKLGKYEEALKCYDKVIELRPDDEDAWYNKGVTLGKLGKYEEALKCYDKAVELRPDNEEAWYDKGWILGKLGKYEEAMEHFAQAYRLAKGITTEESYAPKPTKTPADEIEISNILIEDTSANTVRVALVQLDFRLEFNKHPEEFGYKLQQKKMLKLKIIKALEIAENNNVNLICFPELCASKEWIDEIKGRWKNMVIVLGSYYENGFNNCPVIIGGQDYIIQKINPSPLLEQEFSGRCMKKGRKILTFQTKYGKIVVLVCFDFKEELYKVLHSADEKVCSPDFIIVPAYNRSVKLFQKLGDNACQEDNYPYILQSNAVRVLNEEAGGTCIIGTDHENAMNRYTWEGFKPNDDIEYKMIEAKGESIIIADLDIRKKGVQVPSTTKADFKMKNAEIRKLE
jgi:tetratricopeptide (TPR) repeat protein/predicted amidohydrolase